MGTAGRPWGGPPPILRVAGCVARAQDLVYYWKKVCHRNCIKRIAEI